MPSSLQNARNFFVGEAPMISGYGGGSGYVQGWFDSGRRGWQDLRKVDGLLEDLGDPVTSMAMLYSLPTQEAMAAQNRPILFRDSTLGALELLTYAGRPLESIPDFRLSPEFLGQFDTFVLPEVEVLSDRHAELIRGWVREGGTLLATYRCGLLDENYRPRANFALSDVPRRRLRFGGEQVRGKLRGIGRRRQSIWRRPSGPFRQIGPVPFFPRRGGSRPEHRGFPAAS